MLTTMTSREFNHDTARAKRAAAEGPVFVTNRGTPELVLLSYNEYLRLSDQRPRLLDLIASPETADIELDIPARRIEPPRPVDLD